MPNDVHQLVAIGQSGGEFWEFVQHWVANVANSGTPADDSLDLISSFQAGAQTEFLACLPSQVNITGYKCKRVNNTGGPTAMLPITPAPGTRSGNLAVGCNGPCIVSSYNNNVRWTTGRWFLPGIIQGDVASNHIASGLVTAVNNFISAFTATFVGGSRSWDFVIWSREFAVPFGPDAVDISLKVGIQKRRLLPVV